MKIKVQNRSVLLCCGKEKCPSVTKKKDFFEIKDDFGGEVKLNKEQVLILSKAISELEKMG
jgi:hypothetical protein